MKIKQPEPIPVSISVRLFQLLIRAYPSSFRHQYGDLMVQVFRDSCLRANHQMRLAGLLILWGRTLVDTILSVFAQYSNRGTEMVVKSSWLKLSGWLMAASSLMFLLSWLMTLRPGYDEFNGLSYSIKDLLDDSANILLGIGMLFIALGVLGLRARYGKQAGSLGLAGLNISLAGAVTTIIGFIGSSISDTSPWWEMTLIGMTVLFVGMILFGIACQQRKIFSRWNSLPLVTGILWPALILLELILSVTNTGQETPGIVTAVILIAAIVGVGLIGLLMQDEAGNSQAVPV